MNALKQLERAGYQFSLVAGERIHYTFQGVAGSQPPAWTRPLLVEIKAQRPEVVAILRQRLVDMITNCDPATDEWQDSAAQYVTVTRPPEGVAVSNTGDADTNRTKRLVVFPADTPLPFPAGSWRRLDDGRIEAQLSYDDLATMLYWRDVILRDENTEIEEVVQTCTDPEQSEGERIEHVDRNEYVSAPLPWEQQQTTTTNEIRQTAR